MKRDETYWEKLDPVKAASKRGFNAIVELPKLLTEAYPDIFKDKTLGFFIEDDLPDRKSKGWDHLTTSYFPDTDDFNRAMPLRFGISVEGINVKYKDYFLMYQPKWWREKFLEAQVTLDDEKFKRTFGNREEEVKDSRIDSKKGEKIVEDVEYDESSKTTITVEKRGPGRPKGSKNKKE